jgi:transmembrane 9 superfamily member 3
LQSIGEYLSGHLLRPSGHDVQFASDRTETCTTEPLSPDQANQFVAAIQHRWLYQMYLDDLPVWGMVGELVNREDGDYAVMTDMQSSTFDLLPMVYTTRMLTVQYNQDQIVQVDVHSDVASLQAVATGDVLTFTLTVNWESTRDAFHSRFDRYLDPLVQRGTLSHGPRRAHFVANLAQGLCPLRHGIE